MRIDGLLAAYSPEALKSPSGGARTRERSGDSSIPSRKADSVQISSEAREHLEKVRKRIESGFYDSESVAEDISDKLGGVLDEMTR
jgi:hypothetical protein